jgi:FAD/FMN-containing dehydrogenase
MNEPVVTLDDGDPTRTDILHEYFVAPDRFADFVGAAKAIIPGSYQELLNITLRWVEQDPVSVLSYAPDGPRIASVLLFSQEMTARAEADMARMTRELIDAVLAIGGSYYLPYRPHAKLEQFLRCYPRTLDFLKVKLEADPKLLLRNALWDNYLDKAFVR